MGRSPRPKRREAADLSRRALAARARTRRDPRPALVYRRERRAASRLRPAVSVVLADAELRHVPDVYETMLATLE
ncbi:hypothetical protein [Natronococcus wangiae]|uniref:hypothetical protein n=1 Tax=Natronococcus wangiae TaxID=3068275 RepID=UPI00273F052A|nr:hypothetical protein [Natronococcus sp. AD5]